jgi:hypothetical protein
MTTILAPATTVTTAEAPADIMLACDDLYCDPFDAAARDRVQALLIPGRDAQPAAELVRKSGAGAPTSANCGCTTNPPRPAWRHGGDGNAGSSRYQISRGAAMATTSRSENTSANRVKGEHAMSPSASDRQSSTDADYALVREFSRELKIACDELHDNPFDTVARDTLRTLLAERGPVADAALNRLSAETVTQPTCRTR